jgi:hypothetical protein
VELVRELHEREGWRALGHDSWPAFCRAELPQLAVIVRGMPKAERRAKVSELRASGMSLRDVAEVTGLAPNTVRSDSAGVQLVAVKSRDGAMRPATAAPATPAKRRPKTDRTVELLRAAGPDGLTVLQVARELRCPSTRPPPRSPGWRTPADHLPAAGASRPVRYLRRGKDRGARPGARAPGAPGAYEGSAQADARPSVASASKKA